MVGYLIALVDVDDPVAYKRYTDRVPALVAQHGGRFVVRGGAPTALEGSLPAGRIVVIEFPSKAAVEAFYEAPEYQEIVPLRQAASEGRLLAVEGYDG